MANLMMAACLVALLLSPTLARGMSHASIQSMYGQLLTSSTLRWLQRTSKDHRNNWQQQSNSEFAAEYVSAGTGDPDVLVCLAEHRGNGILGSTDKATGECLISFVGKVYKKRDFQVLLNVDGAAKLDWRSYSRFSSVPVGAVAGVDGLFIGRHLKGAKFLPGAIPVASSAPGYSAFGAMDVIINDRETEQVYNGEVLVEIEPERYELELLDSSGADYGAIHPPKVTRSDVVLAKSSLFRFDEGKDRKARLQKVLSYEYEKSDYYGQIPGMIRALSTSIRLPNGQVHSIRWGLPESSKQKETLMVGHLLQHHSAVDVSVVGVRVTEESSYHANLVSVFPGGAKRKRRVSGVLQRMYLNNIRPEYSRVYHIKDSVVVSASEMVTEPPATTLKTSNFYELAKKRGGERGIMMSDEKEDKGQSSAVTSHTSASASGPVTSPSFSFILLLLLRHLVTQ